MLATVSGAMPSLLSVTTMPPTPLTLTSISAAMPAFSAARSRYQFLTMTSGH
jgi:hypothetical protein